MALTKDARRTIHEVGVVAVIRAADWRTAVDVVEPLLAGGVRGIEITYTTPDAARAIAAIADRHGDDLALGAGTIREAGQATAAVDAGADFLVSPGTDEHLAAEMKATGALTVLGALTPTEVMHATRLGADIIKVFPAGLQGPGLLKALAEPFPEVDFVPTGGVTAENLPEWFAAGAVAVGAGSSLCSSQALARADWSEVERRARRFADAFAAVR
ncbi:bifunctional 4-hydroxy-2-oxoglutarate aldolase/2-dehydro-3-deoxy-phosphogluconate aldolase [Gryllotalpicola reticulitermitis]|uniref:Bifunctional 4-hydroxy-2-oxoglutarate aldolase/2-dehydro-3-deoxy-phosphogluconate aldolase n=1 Tax=Gryllotalpicola reticulitermitis TaxID=1184153 RepID=A0ABV8Q187_9MICO